METAETTATSSMSSGSMAAVNSGQIIGTNLMTPATVVNNNNNATTNPVQLIDEIATENFWLREKMKEISADRDRLLCEVANLRLELDMAELKRLPEDRWVNEFSFFSFSNLKQKKNVFRSFRTLIIDGYR